LHRLLVYPCHGLSPTYSRFQRQVLINPYRDKGEINEIKKQFQQRRERLAASLTYSRLSTTRSYQFPWDGGEINSFFGGIENQFQQLQEKLAANPNVAIAAWRR
jgi:hypothetical protein